MAYRQAAEQRRRTEVLHYRPSHSLSAAAMFCLLTLGSIFTLVQARNFARGTRVDCVRGGENTCFVKREYGVFTTEQRLPIHHMRSIGLTTHRTKRGTDYGVEIAMQSGDRIALLRPTTRSQAELVKSGVELVAFDARPGAAGLPVQGASPFAAAFFLLFGVGLGAFALMFLRSARVEFDFDRATIKVSVFRFPLAQRHRVFRADEVQRARVAMRTGSKGSVTYETFLVLEDEEFSLVSGGGGSESRNEEAARKINEALAKMREEAA